MAKLSVRAVLLLALLSISMLPLMDAATPKKKTVKKTVKKQTVKRVVRKPTRKPTRKTVPRRTPAPKPIVVASGDLAFTTASPPVLTVRTPTGAVRGTVALGTVAKVGKALTTAVSPSGSLAVVMTLGSTTGATILNFVSLKPLKFLGSVAVAQFGTYKAPAPLPMYWQPGGFVLAVSDLSKSGVATVYLDAVAAATNCSTGYINTLTFTAKGLKLSPFQSITPVAKFGTSCPTTTLPTLVESSELIGSSLYMIQNLVNQDILIQEIIAKPTAVGTLKPTLVSSARGLGTVGNCFTYAIGDAVSFYAACEVGTSIQVRLAKFTAAGAKLLTSGNLEAAGSTFRFLATTPKNRNLFAALSRSALKGKARPDFIAAFDKTTGKLVKSFDTPPAYVNFNVVP